MNPSRLAEFQGDSTIRQMGQVSDRPKPWPRRWEVLFTAALFVSALGLFSLEWFYDLHWEGISTVGAERILRGEVPYRDFWTMYAPGHFYLLALFFQSFGIRLVVEVVAASAVCAAAVCVCYRLVVNLVGRRLVALACAGIFLAAVYNTGYFKRLGTYPPAILLIFVAFNLMVLYYRAGKLSRLIAAGLATGAVTVCKHDVGGYTAIAAVAGLIAHHLLTPAMTRAPSLPLKLASYSAGVAAVVLPLLISFAALAGADMLQDLIVFPLTDFRFVRPEGYPSLLPFGLYDESWLKTLNNFFRYVYFTAPFALCLLGLIATGVAVRRRQLTCAAAGVTFSVGYLLHYGAAHIQINTHLATMSVYAASLGAIFYHLEAERFAGRVGFVKLLAPALAVGWFLSLAAKPVYLAWEHRQAATAELRLAKVSGFKLPPLEAHALAELAAFVDTHTQPSHPLFVGLHRHDVVIFGDVMVYFILNRPSATRYHEPHPAVMDTAHVQREVIGDLLGKNVALIILKHVLSDQELEREKKNFLQHLPHIGATHLDEFIREHYVEVQKFGPYAVWKRKATTALAPADRVCSLTKPVVKKDVSSPTNSRGDQQHIPR